MSGETQRWVIVARILRPRGNKGEVAADLLTDFPERLTRLTEVFLGVSGGAKAAEPRSTALKACWLSQNHKGQAVFHFEGCNSISEAEKFRGLDVLLPIEKRVALSAGQYFVDDLIGCSVFETFAEPSVASSSPCSLAAAPSLLGVVREVQIAGEGVAGTPLLVVDTSAGELLIPLAEDICTSINTAARRIDVVLPGGLRDLNEKT
ncbi:MAG: ribosome maturation factor RimM [Candidatus Acidiferrales bacterium]